MRDIKILSAIGFMLGVFGLVIWWQVYQFQDCKKVGHGTMYCIGRIGK